MEGRDAQYTISWSPARVSLTTDKTHDTVDQLKSYTSHERVHTMFTIKNRTLVHQFTEYNLLQTFHLEEVRDYLKKLEKLQDPWDIDKPLSCLAVQFRDGAMRAAWKDDEKERWMLFSSTGASQTQGEVLPGHFFRGLRELAEMDHSGALLAEQVWDKFARRCDTPVRVRTVRMKVDDKVHRVIRSCVSKEYALYSNLGFVEDILSNAGDLNQMPVVDWKVSDQGMRIRFAGMDDGVFTVGQLIPQAALDEPIAMVEAWNSEVGVRRVGLRGGLYRLSTLAGIGHWNSLTEYNWIHRGSSSRIQQGVTVAFRNLFTTAEEVIAAYRRSRNISVSNAEGWMKKELKALKVAERIIENAVKALAHPNVSKYEGMLSSVVDAIAIAARSEQDMVDQYEIERIASNLLIKGIHIAERNNDHIEYEG